MIRAARRGACCPAERPVPGQRERGQDRESAQSPARHLLPHPSGEKQTPVQQTLGKEGSAVTEQSIYTVPLPRNELKMTLQGIGLTLALR
jgi:hypothetical protein